jgi:hypothetical protein
MTRKLRNGQAMSTTYLQNNVSSNQSTRQEFMQCNLCGHWLGRSCGLPCTWLAVASDSTGRTFLFFSVLVLVLSSMASTFVECLHPLQRKERLFVCNIPVHLLPFTWVAVDLDLTGCTSLFFSVLVLILSSMASSFVKCLSSSP